MLKSRLQAMLADPGSAVGLMWRLLTEYGFSRWHRYAFALALMGVGAAATGLTAYLIGDIINKAYVNKDFPAVLQVSIAVMVIFALRGAATYGQSVMLSRIGNSIIAENQRRLFDKTLQQNLTFFSERHSSEMLARLSGGAAAASSALNLLITSVGRDFLTLASLVLVMVTQDPLLALIGLIITPPIILGLRKLTRRAKNVAMSQWLWGARTIETLQETIQGIRMVKSFTLEDRMRTRFDTNVAAVEKDANKLARVGSRTAPLVESLAGLAVGFILIYAGYRVVVMGAAPGEFVSFMTAFLLAYEPAKRLARLNIDLNVALVGVRVLFEVIDQPATEPADESKPDIKITAARLEFDQVNFAYRPEEPVLTDMTFVAEAGRMTALVGPSGGGKSTVLNLILHFYDVQSGIITIDGQDIASVSRRSLRNQIAYVGQDIFLFNTTIRDNIAFGHPTATEDEIVAAAKAAMAHDFIMTFPNGYDTLVGERGAGLSGGERQRVAIARALVRNAPLILLDEATAALDSESEYKVQRAVAELCKGRTTIVIAHRLSTIMHADRILVVEDGRIADSGRHEELLRTGGKYASFYRLQLQHQQTHEPLAVAQA